MREKMFYCPYCGKMYCIQGADYRKNYPIASLENEENDFIDHRQRECLGTRQEFNEETGIFNGDVEDFKRRIKEKFAQCESNYALTMVAYYLGVI